MREQATTHFFRSDGGVRAESRTTIPVQQIKVVISEYFLDLTVIETMPMGEIEEDRTDRYLPLFKLPISESNSRCANRYRKGSPLAM